MIFTPTPLRGAWVIGISPHTDPRGFFARTWSADEFGRHGLEAAIVQCSMSRNPRGATLRGLHWQADPHGEVKVVRCTRGALWDVIVDLRPESPTYLRHFSTELRADTASALYVPRGFAHGFVTLEDDTDVSYQMSTAYVPDAERGARWNDPAFGIVWPIAAAVMSERDATYPDFVPRAS